MTSTQKIDQRLLVLDFPTVIWVGKIAGQWPIKAFVNEAQTMSWLGETPAGERRYAFRVDLVRGIRSEVTLVERVVERRLDDVLFPGLDGS
jgi:hypothetical protein